MDAIRWQQVEQVYHAALKQKPGQRAAFLLEVCGDEVAIFAVRSNHCWHKILQRTARWTVRRSSSRRICWIIEGLCG